MCLELDKQLINFVQREVFVIEPNTTRIIYANVKNRSKEVGYIDSYELHRDILFCDALVKNQEGIAVCHCLIIGQENVEIEVPVVELQDYEEVVTVITK